MKKLNLAWILGIFASAGVYAQPNVPDFVGRVFEAVINLFSILLHGGPTSGPLDPGNSIILSQLLFFIIIISVVWIGVSRISLFSDRSGATALVSIAVSLLATRWLHIYVVTQGALEGLLLPYGALGIAITTLIPFIVFYGFMEDIKNNVVRKSGWVLLAVIFFSFWWIRYDELGDLAWIYAIAAALSLAFLWFDGTLRRWRVGTILEKEKYTASTKRLGVIHGERRELMEALNNLPITQRARRADIKARIKEVDKEIKDLESGKYFK